ncbi:farnesyl diphosphate synthase [Hyphomicrobium sp. LHD-15]|uniref:polyprenyl synthetase family protein n=1 Tax=Hyphomicrobium sp. LHD-15 TaxID=3072142 RepID=UPI0028107897|nr:farnesyl diphosphate synthase [Hyphomicrobium sp. LHD-15]MDQ8698796.1 polyprenyl synthetase family protein [Hyphomicrobium sp. LHD-15]
MTFTQRLDRIAGLTDVRLAALIGSKIEQSEGATPVPARLLDALRHATLGGGKRFRPFLVIESAALFGLSETQALDTAAALECVHCYSLVHDDLPAMDNDAVRRGLPTVWKAFDEWTAILAGDALLTLAFEILSRVETHHDPETRLALISGLAKAAGGAGMVGGQALDLEAERRPGGAPLSLPEVLHLQSLKTGALIRFACEAGAVLGGATADQRDALLRYGAHVGLAFQIADDLLDAEGDAATVGKAVSKDAAAGKATLVSLMGLEAARAELRRVEAAAIEALALFGAKAEPLIEAARFVARRDR